MNVVEILKELIKEKYYIGMPDNQSIIQMLLNYFSGAKEVKIVTDSNGLNHLLIGLNCELHDLDHAILLSGHMDTIKPGESWDTSPRVEDGKVYGLGSTDMKAFFASLIANKDEIMGLGLPVVISITFDEETLGNGIVAIVEELKKCNIHCDYALIGEPTENQVVTSSRGNSVYVIKTIGKACHSMRPENGINALYPIAQLVLFIESLNEKYKGIASLNPILSEGGTMPNQVCGLATLKLSIRTSSTTLRDQIIGEVSDKLNELSQQYQVETVMIPVFELKAFERRESKINSAIMTEFQKSEDEYMATTEAGEIQSMGIKEITIMGPGDLNLAHKENEYCDLALLLEYSEMLPSILKMIVEKIKKKASNK